MGTEKMELTTLEKVMTYIFGGRSLFTLISLKSGKHLVFQVKKDKKNFKLFYVWSRVTEPNTRRTALKYLGMIIYDLKENRFTKTTKSAGIEGDLHFKVFSWYWNMLNKHNRLPTTAKLYHHGRCAVCGRKLTDPESIERGIGPICWKDKMGQYAFANAQRS
mgnify:FL=1